MTDAEMTRQVGATLKNSSILLMMLENWSHSYTHLPIAVEAGFVISVAKCEAGINSLCWRVSLLRYWLGPSMHLSADTDHIYMLCRV